MTLYSAKIEYEKPSGKDGTLTLTHEDVTQDEIESEILEYVPDAGQALRIGSWEGEPHEEPADAMVEYHEWIMNQYDELDD